MTGNLAKGTATMTNTPTPAQEYLAKKDHEDRQRGLLQKETGNRWAFYALGFVCGLVLATALHFLECPLGLNIRGM